MTIHMLYINKKLSQKVLILGVSMYTKGGMTAVLVSYKKFIEDMQFIPTWKLGNKLVKLWYAIQAIVRTWFVCTFNKNIKIVQSDLGMMLKNNPEKIVLGCTHYPYLLDVLSKFTSRDRFIDPAEYFVNYIAEDLKENKLLNNNTQAGYEKMYVSANPEQFKIAAKMFYEVKELPELV